MIKKLFRYNLIEATKEVAIKYPLTLAVALTQFILITTLILFEKQNSEIYYAGVRSVIVGFIGLPLSVFAHRRKNISLILLSIVLLGIGYWYYGFYIQRFSQAEFYVGICLIITAHLLVSIAKTENFWEVNKNLFLSFITAVFYAGVITLGLLGALSAIYYLLYAFNEKAYLISVVFVNSIFTTIFFLSLLIEKEKETQGQATKESALHYPTALRKFASYVLAPLSLVYAIIVYLYIIKIILTQQLPEGYISWLCIDFSIIHIFSYLLLWPLRTQVNQRFIYLYLKYSPYILVPISIMMTLSIFIRTNSYGLTINRYIVITTAFWISFVVLWLIINKGKSIKFIPFSLALVISFISLMPYVNFLDMPLRSQTEQFEALLQKNKLLNAQGKIEYPKNYKISEEDYNRLNNIGYYIEHNQRSKQNLLANYLTEKNLKEITGNKKDSLIGITQLNLPDFIEKTNGKIIKREKPEKYFISEVPYLNLEAYATIIFVNTYDEKVSYKELTAFPNLSIQDSKAKNSLELKKIAHQKMSEKTNYRSDQYKGVITIDTVFNKRKIKVVLKDGHKIDCEQFSYYLLISEKGD